MLSDAIREIQQESAREARRHRGAVARRDLKHRLDDWTQRIEDLLERDQDSVPRPLLVEVAAFLDAFDARLSASALHDAHTAHVLDLLFDAQEKLQVGHVPALETRM